MELFAQLEFQSGRFVGGEGVLEQFEGAFAEGGEGLVAGVVGGELVQRDSILGG